ncbi:MAG TPA: hypothetical protein VLL48_06475 [Longimicrobiales bacterium]|nr:hypothetical protein [Longimicrobiales bacterium]
MGLRRWTTGGLTTGLVAVAVSCGGGRTAPPAAGDSYGAVPPLQGREVMVMPAQRVRGVPRAEVDPEIAFALGERSERVGWVLPDQMRGLLERSPAVQVSLDALPVAIFLQAEVERVGDPLLGELIRIAALTGADVALIPVEVRHRPAGASAPGAVEIVAALLNARNGRVLWFGVVEGEPGSPGDPGALATAADALARAVVW